MAYSGYLIKVGGANGTILPMKYVAYNSYNITPNQRMESEANRAVTGLLHRSTVSHTATKIEYNTPPLTNDDVDSMMTLFKNAWTSTIERKLKLQYYDMETNSYKEGDFYMPDIKFEIERLEGNTVHYSPIRIAFIEY